MRALIARCLAKEPDGRPASMETVLTMLSSSAESLAAPHRALSSPRARRTLGLVTLVVAAAGGTLLANTRAVGRHARTRHCSWGRES